MTHLDTPTAPSNQRAHAPPAPVRWPGWLALQLAQRDGRTVLVDNRHAGPLRVQKLLQPHPSTPAELLLVHPPGGIAGGDRLQLDLHVATGAQVLVTTPGATRWYRSNDQPAWQVSRLQVAGGATLEWMPQDTIVQAQADGSQDTRVDLEAGAAAMGCDLVQLGQPQADRPWREGRWRQAFELHRDGRLLLAERMDVSAEQFMQASPVGLAGYSVMGMLWASGPALQQMPDALLARLREFAQADAAVCAGVSWLAPPTGCLVVRALAQDAQVLRQRMLAVWAELRPLLIGCPARLPRIWAT